MGEEREALQASEQFLSESIKEISVTFLCRAVARIGMKNYEGNSPFLFWVGKVYLWITVALWLVCGIMVNLWILFGSDRFYAKFSTY